MATWQEFAAGYGDIPAVGSLSGVHNSKLFDTMLRQIASRIGYTGETSIPGTYQFENVNEGGTFMETAQGTQASPEFLKALEAYQFDRTSPLQGTISKDGQNVGTFTAGNKDTGFDKVANVAVPLALTAIGGQLASGLLSGAGASGAVAGDAMQAAADQALATSGNYYAQSGIGQAMMNAANNAAASGGLLGTAGELASGAAGWMKANPVAGRLILGGATSLLSGIGGSGGSGSSAPSGPPVKWSSPIQQGLLSEVKQYAPEAITQNKPAGLLAQGYTNDGAWRYLKG